MNVVGNKIVLRAIEREDLPFLRELMNDSENEKYVVGWSLPVSEKEQEEWFLGLKKVNDTIRYSIEFEGKFVGTCILNNIDWKNRNLGINIKLLNKFKGLGLGKETIQLAMKYIFEELNMNRIEANILEYNEASIALFERCGFKQEGRRRQKVFKNNKYNDIIEYSILKEEYENK